MLLGAFKTSPIECLHAEADKILLNFTCDKMALQHYTKLNSCSSNHSYKIHSQHNTETIKHLSFEWQLLTRNQKYHWKQSMIIPFLTLLFGPFDFQKYYRTYANCKKQIHIILTYRKHSKKIKANYLRQMSIFTDGSKHKNMKGCAAFFQKKVSSISRPDETSIFKAETCAIDLALGIISTNKNEN